MRVLFLVLALIGAACAAPRQSTRIVGGETTNIEKYPFMSCMIYKSRMELIQFCGGTLISSTSVVSASHCYEGGLVPSLVRVRLGSYLAYSGGELHTISRIILHEEYNSYLATNDVAIVKLTHPAVFSNKIKTARIAGPHYILPDNTRVNAVGWGDTEFNGRPSEVLRHVAIYTINQKLCTERYAYLKTLPDTTNIPSVTPEMFCAGILDLGGKDTCQGDSGGPIIHGEDVLVGITSWGHQCANDTYPGVNVRVSSYTDWIYTNSKNL